ncbi:MAG: YegP family protein [Micropruina sp.]|nr:YegP family protein [Micropruina sp.]
MSGKFEVYEDASGKFRFRLKAGNGEVVATGQSYTSLAGVKAGVDAVKRAAEGAAVVQLEKE